MPKILRIINRLNLGGPTFNAALLTRHLAPEYETLLIAGTKQDSEESSAFIVKEQGIRFEELPEMRREINPVHDFKAYKKIVQIIREFKPDIVHTHAAKAGALGRLAAWNEKVPVIVHTFHGHVFHSYFSPTKTKLFLQIERYLAKRSNAIIAISEKQREELGTTFRVCEPEKIHVVPLGFDLARFRENPLLKRQAFRTEYRIVEDELAVGIIGRLVPVKNHGMFLDSILKISKEVHRPVRFFIVGDGECREGLMTKARELGLDFTYYPDEPRKALVTFTSWRRDVDTVIAGLDLVVLTSWNEGTPVSLIEAQAGGKPIVSTRVGGIENAVLPAVTAELVEPGDVRSFSESIVRVLNSPERMKQMGAAGWPFVEARFHYSRLVEDMRKLYRKLLNQAGNQV